MYLGGHPPSLCRTVVVAVNLNNCGHALVYRGAASAELKLTRLPRRSRSRESAGDPIESTSQHRCTPGWAHTRLLP